MEKRFVRSIKGNSGRIHIAFENNKTTLCAMPVTSQLKKTNNPPKSAICKNCYSLAERRPKQRNQTHRGHISEESEEAARKHERKIIVEIIQANPTECGDILIDMIVKTCGEVN